MIDYASGLADGRYAVPGNRWDLLAEKAQQTSTDPALVSVIVPFYDNQHDLDLLLAGLSVQTHPLGRLQIVIADDGSPTPPHVPELAQGLDISVVHQEDRGFRAGTARNLGVSRSDGDVLLFLDGDTVPSPHYVQELAKLPTVLPDAVVTGRRRYANLASWSPEDLLTWFSGGRPGPDGWDEPSWMIEEYRRTDNLLRVHPRSYKYLIGAVMGCSRAMFDAVSGFDESIVGYGGEDYDFTYRAYNCGAVLAHVPGAVAWHDGPEWAGRTTPANHVALKNREMMTLAARIPEPSMRGDGQLYRVPDTLVSVWPQDWSLGAGVRCLRSLLTALDCAITLMGTCGTVEALAEAFHDDPRVTHDQGERAVHGLDQARSRVHLTVTQPVLVSPAFNAQIEKLLENDVGSVLFKASGRVVVVAESHRRRSRVARHRAVPAELAQGWFASYELEDHRSGVELICAEPDLASHFGRY